MQAKYHTANWRPRAYERDYAHNPSAMTSFGIDECWSLTTDVGLTPRLVTLVPENHLDDHYALAKDAG